MDLFKGKKLICNESNIIKGNHSLRQPKKDEKVVVRKIRIYEKTGFTISLENYDENLFFDLKCFRELDLDFAEELIKGL